MAKGDSISKVLFDFGEKTIEALRQSYIREKGKHPHATSMDAATLIAAIDYKVKVFGNEFTFTLSLPEYWKYQEEGVKGTVSTYPESVGSSFQRKTKHVPTKVLTGLTGWISRKGIDPRKTLSDIAAKSGKKQVFKDKIKANKSLAYVLSRSIHRKGVRGNHFYSKVINDELITGLNRQLSAALQRDVRVEIKEFFKEIKE